MRNDNVKFINQNNITVSGMTAPGNGHIVKAFEGKKIYTPDIIHSAHIDTVIVPNSPKVFSEIKAQCLAEFPGVKRIVHLTELIG